jgi:hypothetical protein
MTLREARCRFTELSVLLIAKAKELGYEAAWDDVKSQPIRMDCPHCGKELMTKTKHKKDSVHEAGCALDLLLYKDGLYLPDQKYYVELGEYWEGLDPDCKNGRSWGDGNHFSFSPISVFGGRK